MSHTREPWSLDTSEGNEIRGINRVAVTMCNDMTFSDAARIVACVNELAGKPEGYVKQLEAENTTLDLRLAGAACWTEVVEQRLDDALASNAALRETLIKLIDINDDDYCPNITRQVCVDALKAAGGV